MWINASPHLFYIIRLLMHNINKFRMIKPRKGEGLTSIFVYCIVD